MPDETKEVMVDGWYHTRDMGYLDENGYLYISGRKSDMIISGGENIFPLEVENVLRMREDIAEVCVLGVPDDYWGESVQAVVVLRPGSKLTPEECALIAASLPNPRKFNSSRPGNYMLKKTKEDTFIL